MTSWSQHSIDWKELLDNGTTAKLDLFLDSIDLGERGRTLDYYNRTLTPSFNERIIYIEDTYGYDSMRSSWYFDTYQISIIQSEDSIVFAKVDTLSSIFESEVIEGIPVFQFESNRLMKKVNKEFKQTYQVALNRDELFNTSIQFGLKCGRYSLPIPTGEYAKISDYVEKKQINKLRNYLTSTCLEKQLFGIQGFYDLKTDENYTIRQTDQALIDFILSKSGVAIYCSGCGIVRMELVKFKEKFGF
ncbi:MAG: hypothetical protein A3D31_04020 [Candidatus Fluviicola riflensis]|nr:MAG: hypothetical protein CHH17_11010 [Candidatus Fluviicola riflensis]OGS79144.1 MAG: hypothetical protein A3D31_04020 [Candidatus Fluviicola riflensis]OGS86576.1 MAG: hypothetical protein A2724_03480 [Fluviicola sp. RIFCSPHIGHO2_01_FULL_43_53]OGS88950.1 MAG: hypothetical protein A3E30_01180 [Fluviicola sp. RIFCSPHIGHO2_12_FULL_43_24]